MPILCRENYLILLKAGPAQRVVWNFTLVCDFIHTIGIQVIIIIITWAAVRQVLNLECPSQMESC